LALRPRTALSGDFDLLALSGPNADRRGKGRDAIGPITGTRASTTTPSETSPRSSATGKRL
jgi:hypothetical protein